MAGQAQAKSYLVVAGSTGEPKKGHGHAPGGVRALFEVMKGRTALEVAVGNAERAVEEKKVSGLLVVTTSDEMAKRFGAAGHEVLVTGEVSAAALPATVKHLAKLNKERVIIMQGDAPLITGAMLEKIDEAAAGYKFALTSVPRRAIDRSEGLRRMKASLLGKSGDEFVFGGVLVAEVETLVRKLKTILEFYSSKDDPAGYFMRNMGKGLKFGLGLLASGGAITRELILKQLGEIRGVGIVTTNNPEVALTLTYANENLPIIRSELGRQAGC